MNIQFSPDSEGGGTSPEQDRSQRGEALKTLFWEQIRGISTKLNERFPSHEAFAADSRSALHAFHYLAHDLRPEIMLVIETFDKLRSFGSPTSDGRWDPQQESALKAISGAAQLAYANLFYSEPGPLNPTGWAEAVSNVLENSTLLVTIGINRFKAVFGDGERR